MEKMEEFMRRPCCDQKVWLALPAETDGQHAAVKPGIRLRDAAIGHVKVAVLKHQSLARLEEVLKTHASLGQELHVTGNFPCVLVESCAKGA